MEAWLAEAKETSLLFHPYISEAGERGPFVDAAARASFIGLETGHGFADMVRAVFNGLAMAARDCYVEMGPLPSRVRLTGGAARSASLRRILGGALGCAVQTSEREEAGAAGAAMIAAVSLGIYGSMADCVKEWVTPYQRPPEPADQAMAAYFDAAFPTYGNRACPFGRSGTPFPMAPARLLNRKDRNEEDRHHRRPVHAADDVSTTRSWKPAATRMTFVFWNSPGRMSRWSMAMPSRAWTD